ncbi:unnamed protein product [Chrysoparadoxa australica]
MASTVDTLTQEVVEVRGQMEKLTAEKEDLLTKISVLELSQDTMTLKLATTEEALANIKAGASSHLKKKQAELKKLQSNAYNEINALLAEVEELQKKVTALEDEKVQLSEKLGELGALLDEARQSEGGPEQAERLKMLESKRAGQTLKMASLLGSMDEAEARIREAIAKERQKVVDLESGLTAKDVDIQRLEVALGERQDEVERLEAGLVKMEQQLENKQSTVKHLWEKIGNIKTANGSGSEEEARFDVAELLRANQEMEKTITQQSQELEEIHRKEAALTADVLRDLKPGMKKVPSAPDMEEAHTLRKNKQEAEAMAHQLRSQQKVLSQMQETLEQIEDTDEGASINDFCDKDTIVGGYQPRSKVQLKRQGSASKGSKMPKSLAEMDSASLLNLVGWFQKKSADRQKILVNYKQQQSNAGMTAKDSIASIDTGAAKVHPAITTNKGQSASRGDEGEDGICMMPLSPRSAAIALADAAAAPLAQG